MAPLFQLAENLAKMVKFFLIEGGFRQRKGAAPWHRFMKYGDMESYSFAPEQPYRDVHGNNLHDYRCSRYACSAETCIFCLRQMSLIVLPLSRLLNKSSNKTVVNVGCLRPAPKDFQSECNILFIPYYYGDAIFLFLFIYGYAPCQPISCILCLKGMLKTSLIRGVTMHLKKTC